MRLLAPIPLLLSVAAAWSAEPVAIRFGGELVTVPGADLGVRGGAGDGVVIQPAIALRLAPGVTAGEAATRLGLVAGSARHGWTRFTAVDAASAAAAGERALREGLAAQAEQEVLRSRNLRGGRVVPSDPFFANQWNLTAINCPTTWNHTTGAGISVAVIDSGISGAHQDLFANYKGDLSWDFLANKAGAEPLGDYHGTMCASLVAAAQNGVGMSGVAPSSSLIGVRLIDDQGFTSITEANALSWQSNHSLFIGGTSVSNNSWGPFDNPIDDGEVAEEPGAVVESALLSNVSSGRGGKGIAYVWASGNGRLEGDSADWDGYASNPFTLAIGATADTGVVASYSEGGACLLACAPGGDGSVTTAWILGAGSTTAANSYQYGIGTSFAAPTVSGVAALMLSVNPWMSWRDLRWVLARTASKTDPTALSWQTNGIGLHWSPDYGFGQVDANAAVLASAAFARLPVRQEPLVVASELLTDIPDFVTATGPAAGANLTVKAPADYVVESVVLMENVTHPRQGDLEFTVISPAGTRIQVVRRPNDTAASRIHRFHLTGFLGESAAGVWTAEVRDRRGGETGRANVLELTIYGFRGTAPAVDPTGGGVVIPPGGIAQSVGSVLGSGALSLDGSPYPRENTAGASLDADAGGGCGSGGGLALLLGSLALIGLRRRRV